MLELPEKYATVSDATAYYDRWHFAGLSRDAAIDFMIKCGFTADQLTFVRSANWTENETESTLLPSDELILGLSPEARAALYSKLIVDPANRNAIEPSWFRVGNVDARLRGSGISEESTAMLKRLLYSGTDDDLLFNDLKPAVRAIKDPVEQVRFLKAVTRKRAMLLRLLIDANTDTAALADYWGRDQRQTDLQPLLDSMKYNAIAGVENPSKINIATLLPPFVQERLYRHADTTQPADHEPEDCFWTAFNFFCDVPDERVHDMTYLSELLRTDYVKISEPARLGDVIILADAKGDAIHAANYIADDIVLTKNGFTARQPWILTQMRDIIAQYRIKTPAMTIGYFRKK